MTILLLHATPTEFMVALVTDYVQIFTYPFNFDSAGRTSPNVSAAVSRL